MHPPKPAVKPCVAVVKRPSAYVVIECTSIRSRSCLIAPKKFAIWNPTHSLRVDCPGCADIMNPATSRLTLRPSSSLRTNFDSFLRHSRTLACLTSPRRMLISHNILSRGRASRKCSKPPRMPSSLFIASAMRSAACCTSESSNSANFCTAISTDNSAIGHGEGPTPARCTISPHMNWSPKKGQTNVGNPNRRPAAVVPAPPW
mmetsp:Transcript_39319/g.57849  ORF Transcript_39319/g.57849 Transcript_39319/m.57849 type:complete len:203 (+) Transcript_39319:821-1429(+)